MVKLPHILPLALAATLLFAGCNPEPQPTPQELEPIPADVPLQGFYKDIFMDGGIALTSRTTLPIVPYLGLTMEYFASCSSVDDMSALDTLIQTNVFSQNDQDENGCLLYPDGAPRFRMIYVNGGKSGAHGFSLNTKGNKGLKRIREFYAKGGSYVGTCAGAYMSSCGSGTTTNPNYLGIWPGYSHPTSLNDTYTDMKVEPGSALLNYYDFGGDGRVAHVRHNGGCYMSSAAPRGTEVLLRYYCPDTTKVHMQGSIWAFKKDSLTGRVVDCGSHPEGVESGEQRDLMAAMCRYAMDGGGISRAKAELENGVVREMTALYSAGDSSHARIGDLQYHHFAIYLPEGVKTLTVSTQGAEGSAGCNLELYLKKGTFAYPDVATHSATAEGCAQTLTVTAPEAGLWMAAVRCPDTVTATLETYDNGNGKTGRYYRYSGNVTPLNGVPYTVCATWNEK